MLNPLICTDLIDIEQKGVLLAGADVMPGFHIAERIVSIALSFEIIGPIETFLTNPRTHFGDDLGDADYLDDQYEN